MKATEFQSLIDHLGDLTAEQRESLVTAIRSKAGSKDAIALIEARFAAAPRCGHCRSERFTAWGHASSLRRYKCKDCGRTFNALTGTPLAQLHRRDAWLAFTQALADGVSLRKAAKRADVCLETSFRWRHRFLESAKAKKPTTVAGIVEVDETFILKSHKGARKIAGRAPRKRGGKAKKPGLSTREHDCILIVRDRHATTSDALLPNLEAAATKAVLKPIVAKDAVLVSDGRAACRQFANDQGLLHVAIIGSQGEHTWGCYHVQNVNAYASRLKGWLARFRGVASRYLESYLGWRRMIERDTDGATPAHYMMAALA